MVLSTIENESVRDSIPDKCNSFVKAGGLGFEPRSLGPKPNVLPLDDPPMRVEGIEPPHLAVPDFESGASTNSATPANRYAALPR